MIPDHPLDDIGILPDQFGNLPLETAEVALPLGAVVCTKIPVQVNIEIVETLLGLPARNTSLVQ